MVKNPYVLRTADDIPLFIADFSTTPLKTVPTPSADLLDELVALLVVENVGEALQDGGGGGATERGEQRRMRGRRL